MERLDKCILAIEKGYTYNPETGNVTGPKGTILNQIANTGYLTMLLRLNNKFINLLQHHFAWYVTHNEIVNCLDHINGDRTDNRIINLRSVTTQQNHFNRVNTKGYYFAKDKNKWRARIKVDNKSIHLGYFDTEEEARSAYLNGKLKYHIIE